MVVTLQFSCRFTVFYHFLGCSIERSTCWTLPNLTFHVLYFLWFVANDNNKRLFIIFLPRVPELLRRNPLNCVTAFRANLTVRGETLETINTTGEKD